MPPEFDVTFREGFCGIAAIVIAVTAGVVAICQQAEFYAGWRHDEIARNTQEGRDGVTARMLEFLRLRGK